MKGFKNDKVLSQNRPLWDWESELETFLSFF